MAYVTQNAHTSGTAADRSTRLVAVVVTHNRRDQVALTIKRLLSSNVRTLAQVIIVDNASTDGTADWLKALTDPRIDALHLSENLGGAGGFNAGIRHAIEVHNADWVVVMDDDARPFTGALEKFMAVPPVADCVAAAVFYPDDTICEMNRPTLNPFRRPRVFLNTILGTGPEAYHIPDTAYRDTVTRAIDQTSFVGLFIPRHAIEHVGYPDPSLFIYGDDVLYTMALRDAGYSISFDPNICFEHDCSTFDKELKPRFSPLWKAYYAYRNRLFMYKKASGPILFWPLFFLVALRWVAASSRYHGQRKAYFHVLRAALCHGALGWSHLSFDQVQKLARKP